MKRTVGWILLVALLAGCAPTFRHVNLGHPRTQQMTDEAICKGMAEPAWGTYLMGALAVELARRNGMRTCMSAKGYLEE